MCTTRTESPLLAWTLRPCHSRQVRVLLGGFQNVDSKCAFILHTTISSYENYQKDEEILLQNFCPNV